MMMMQLCDTVYLAVTCNWHINENPKTKRKEKKKRNNSDGNSWFWNRKQKKKTTNKSSFFSHFSTAAHGNDPIKAKSGCFS